MSIMEQKMQELYEGAEHAQEQLFLSSVCPNTKDCKIIMFTSDLDICKKCKKQFDGK